MKPSTHVADAMEATVNRRSAITAAFVMALLAGGCASLRPDAPRVPSYAFSHPERTTLGRVFAAQAAEHPGLSGFQVMATGHSAFAARVALADAAERTLDLQYYSADDDLSTDLLLLRLRAAAERGVRVRILLDDVYAPSRRFAWRAMALHPDIQVRLFNPFFFGGTTSLGRLAEYVFDSERLNRRMHNKLWVTDNAAAIVGSRNLGDEYFDVHQSANFADVDLLVAGTIVNQLSQAFDAYWNSAAVVPAQAFLPASEGLDAASMLQYLRARATACDSVPPCAWLTEQGMLAALHAGAVSLAWASAQFVYDPPDQDKRLLPSGIEHGSIVDHPDGSRTRSELLILSPYFIPSAEGRRHLGEMRERGVRVAVLTNSLASTDSPAAHSGYARHRVALLRGGVELYEVRPIPGAKHRLSHRWGEASPSSLHAKLIVQDRRRAIVGSLNQDPRSRLHNTEAWIAVDSGELAADLAALFEAAVNAHHAFKVELDEADGADRLVWSTEEGAEIVRYDVEPVAGPWLRLWRDILGVLVPEHML